MNELIVITAMLGIPAYVILRVFVRPVMTFFSYRGYRKHNAY
jgi:hypothetical protein